MRTYVIFLGIIYALLGLVLIRLSFSYRLVQLDFPLISRFALIGPFVSVGLMELSRRREAGLDTSWVHMIGVVRTASSSVIQRQNAPDLPHRVAGFVRFTARFQLDSVAGMN